MKDNRFLLQKSTQQDNSWVLTDTENGIVCTFERGKFNETQKFTFLNDPTEEQVGRMATIMRKVAEWLYENAYFIAMPTDKGAIRAFFARRIREAREARGISVYKLAKDSGVQAISIHNIESGDFDLRCETLVKLLAALDMNVDDIFKNI